MSTETMQVKEASAGYLAKTQVRDVPPGYKRTEVGVIPNEWQVRRLGQLGQVVRGGSPRPAGDPRFFNGSFIPWLTVAALTNLPDSSLQVCETFSQLTEEGAKRSRDLSPDTLIIANSGATLGVAKILRIRCCANDGIAAVIDQRYGDKTFLCYYINTQTSRLRDIVATGNGQPNLNTTLIREIPIPFPPSTEQRAIAEALSDVDGLLGVLEALIAKKRAIKQAAMQQLLAGKTRLPGFSGEWEMKRLSDLADIDPENLPSNTNPGYKFNYISLEQIDAGRLLGYTEEIFSTAPSRARRVLRDGDVLMATVRPNLMAHFHYRGQVANAVCSTGFAVLRAKQNRADAGFLFAHLFCHIVNRQIEKIVAGSNYPAINSGDVKLMEIPCPSAVGEQTAIATVLADMDAEITALEARRDKTRQLKQGMMQQLLTGRVRLVKSEACAAQPAVESKRINPRSWAFNEAVVISMLAKKFGSEQFPLGRKRYTKLSYLLHRHADQQVEGYLKKAAGPYNPKTKYGGPEKIAVNSRYVHEDTNGRFKGFVASDNIAQAESYFEKWYGTECIQWLEQFRFKSNDELEVLTTVDMAVAELHTSKAEVSVEAVKTVLRSDNEWRAKLSRESFSDESIARAIKASHSLFLER